jgi:DNA ligase-associated metallophosphoesterase
MKIDVAGETLELLPQRAAWWARYRMLIVADIHFGKAAAFRASGIPVPHGTTTDNLEALTRLVEEHGVKQVCFLGDFLHAKAAHAAATLHAIQQWRDMHPGLQLTLVRGNHDHTAGDPPPGLSIETVDEPYHLAPFAFCHHPHPRQEGYVLAGHVHPVHRLSSGLDSVRLPCFLFGPEVGILPSFGAFTGGHAVPSLPGDRLFISTGEAVFAVPPAKPSNSPIPFETG